MLIVAPWGAGANHVRVLLGLRPGGEIRNHDGRRLLDREKLPWLEGVFYNRARCRDWLRMEWLTREHYEDIQIQSDPQQTQLPQIRLWTPDPEPVARLYEAKAGHRNGLTAQQLRDHVGLYQPVEGATNIRADLLFREDFCGGDDATALGVSDRPHHRVHGLWCELNRLVLDQ